jgi:hypothetical protein
MVIARESDRPPIRRVFLTEKQGSMTDIAEDDPITLADACNLFSACKVDRFRTAGRIRA